MKWKWALDEVLKYKYLINKNLPEISYEDLISSPDVFIPKVTSFLGVSYSYDLLDPSYDRSTLELSDSHHQGALNHISKNSSGKWQNNPNKEENIKCIPLI